MAIVKMRRVSISALKKDEKEILDKLQALGIMEMDPVDPDGFGSEDRTEQVREYESRVRETEQALSTLDVFVPEKTSMLSSLEGRALVEKSDFEETIAEEDEILARVRSISEKSKAVSDAKARIRKLNDEKEALAPWSLLGVPLKASQKATAKTSILAGTLPAETTQDSIAEALSVLGEDAAYDLSVLEQGKDAVYISVIALDEDIEEAEQALRSIGLAKPRVETDKPPKEQTEALDQSIAFEEDKIAGITKEIEDLAGERDRIRRLGDYYRLSAGEEEVAGDIAESGRTFVASGYVPENHVAAVQALADKYAAVVDVDDVKEDEDVPTVIRNNDFSSSMEGVVQSYGLPNRKEFDPTTIMSFFYVFFFGLMLSDAAYGLVMTLVCFFLIKKYKRMSPSMHKQLKLFMFCGISTTFWGIMFGGYFGDLITVVAKTFFHQDVTIPAVWFVPLDDPMRLLMWCLLFGVIHLFTGLGIKGYQELQDGKKLDFFCDVVLWYMFLIGLLMMLLPSDLFRSISQLDISFPPALNMLAKVLALAGVVGLVLMSGRDHKNPLLRIALGAYDVYGVTSWLSDVLSYSRLLALGLATGVIASVINQMGSMMGGGIIGAILFIIVFLVGHAMNMAINILGAYVHTNRLQFVEFFGKFYDGSGRPLEPFEQDTKYVEVKEEM